MEEECLGCHNSEKFICLARNDWNFAITCICLSWSPTQKETVNQYSFLDQLTFKIGRFFTQTFVCNIIFEEYEWNT